MSDLAAKHLVIRVDVDGSIRFRELGRRRIFEAVVAEENVARRSATANILKGKLQRADGEMVQGRPDPFVTRKSHRLVRLV